jgi:hypothetical protein
MAETLILDRAEIKALVSPREALEPMRNAFRLYSMKRLVPALRVPSPLPAPAPSDAGAMILVPGVIARIRHRQESFGSWDAFDIALFAPNARSASRPCENLREPRKRRIVSSIAYFSA